ncbi:hypothetical protein ACVW0A_000732 [Pseudomonas sp. TE3610]
MKGIRALGMKLETAMERNRYDVLNSFHRSVMAALCGYTLWDRA